MTIYDELVARGLIAQVTNEEEIKNLVKKFVKFQENSSCSNTNISKASIEIYFVTAEATKTSPIKILIEVSNIFLKSIKLIIVLRKS